ncbi:hypothetical protein [Streptomyces sp. KL2]|uniref:hypothetical protein n=1 Tax=Streptomyces sp. KL2 TaxID=3050126 RepID=UPI00397A04A0
MRDDTVYTYYDNGWTRSATDPFGITTSYDYNKLGQQTRNTLTSAGGSSSRTMTWDFYPSGNQKARSDDGVPVGRHVVLVDSSDTHNTAVQGVWESSQATDQWGYNLRTQPPGRRRQRTVRVAADHPRRRHLRGLRPARRRDRRGRRRPVHRHPRLRRGPAHRGPVHAGR